MMIDAWPFVSVIAPVFNGERTIGRCVESLLQLDYPRDHHEIIVVDNNSRDATATIIKQQPVMYVLANAVQSPGAARNAGARVARGEILAFIDGDCVAEPGWLRAGIAALAADEKIGSVGGRILAYKGDEPQTLVERFQHYNRIFEEANQPDSDSNRLPRAIAGNVMFRRAVFIQLEGFREDLQAGEDTDLSWRMQLETPYRLVFSDESRVYHQHIDTLGALIARARRYGECQAWGYKTYRDRFPWPAKKRRRYFFRQYKNLARHSIAALLAVVKYNFQLLRSDVAIEKVAPVLRFLSHANVRVGRIKGSFKNSVFFP